MLVPHLVMPEYVENATRVLTFIAVELSRDTYVDVMAQYQPEYKAKDEARYDEINRRSTRSESGGTRPRRDGRLATG